MTEQELRIKAMELAIERKKSGLDYIGTFVAAEFMYRFIKGEDVSVLSKETDEITRINFQKWRDEEDYFKIKPIQPLPIEPVIPPKKKWFSFDV